VYPNRQNAANQPEGRKRISPDIHAVPGRPEAVGRACEDALDPWEEVHHAEVVDPLALLDPPLPGQLEHGGHGQDVRLAHRRPLVDDVLDQVVAAGTAADLDHGRVVVGVSGDVVLE